MRHTLNEKIHDVLIVGGGIAGVGCAAMLPDSLSVVLLEAESQCGYHATGRSAAAWVAGYGGEEIRVLTRNSKAYLSDPPSLLGEQSFLSPRGELFIARDKAQEQVLKEQISNTDHLQQISINEACERVPGIKSEGLAIAAYTKEAYDIDADRLLQAWRRKVLKSGAAILTGQQVTALKRQAGVWKISCQGGEVFQAERIVNAAGAWADEVARLAGLDPLGLLPHRRSAALLPELSQHNVADWPLIISSDESWYARPIGNKLMVSPADETPAAPHDAFAEDLTIAQGLNSFEHAVNVTVNRIETTWAGLRTFAPDRVPVVGKDPREASFFWLAGQGGYGIQTAPEMSRLAATLLSDDSSVKIEKDMQNRLNPARLF